MRVDNGAEPRSYASGPRAGRKGSGERYTCCLAKSREKQGRLSSSWLVLAIWRRRIVIEFHIAVGSKRAFTDVLSILPQDILDVDALVGEDLYRLSVLLSSFTST